MAIGKKESKTVNNVTGSVSETNGIIANVLNYGKAIVGAYQNSGDTGVTYKIYGSLDIENANAWSQIGSDIPGPAAPGQITPVIIDDAWDGLKITYAHTGATATNITMFIVRKRR